MIRAKTQQPIIFDLVLKIFMCFSRSEENGISQFVAEFVKVEYEKSEAICINGDQDCRMDLLRIRTSAILIYL